MKQLQQTGDARTYTWASYTLRAGMYCSFVAMGSGLLWWFLSGAPGSQEKLVDLIPITSIVPELLAGNPLALLNLGVLLLLATPGITLLTEIVTYAADRNWRYVAIASLVGAVLLLSVALSMKWISIF